MSQLSLDLGDSPKYNQNLHTLLKALQGHKFESDIEVVFAKMPAVTMAWPDDFKQDQSKPAMCSHEVAAKTRRLELDVPTFIQIVNEITFDLPRLVEHKVVKLGYFIYELDGPFIRYAKIVKTG